MHDSMVQTIQINIKEILGKDYREDKNRNF